MKSHKFNPIFANLLTPAPPIVEESTQVAPPAIDTETKLTETVVWRMTTWLGTEHTFTTEEEIS